jgi:cytochrome c oxidase subunit III
MTAAILPGAHKPQGSTAWLGMACVCATEATLFACLITAYFYLGMRNAHWPPPGIEAPELKVPLLMTAALLLSSVTMAWAERGISHDRPRRLVTGLIATMALGLIFIGLFVHEYAGEFTHMLPQTHAYASLFYLITSLHFLHVSFGLLIIGYTTARAIRGHFNADARVAVATTALYWHFVDAVWLTILVTIYLSPRFL